MAKFLPSLSAESRACLTPLISVVARPSTSNGKANQLRTLCSRTRHWLEWCAINKLPDPLLTSSTQWERNFILACYTVRLSNGGTIKDMNIKHVTIKLYLDAVTKFFARRPHCMPDPCATNLCKWSPLIDKILKEHLRLQTMPKRRTPITKAMIQNWIRKAKL